MKNQMILTAALSMPFLLSTVACSSTGPFAQRGPAEVDTAFLQYADDGAREAVQEARAELAADKDSLMAAELKLKDARQLKMIALEQEDVAEARLEVAETRREVANRTATVDASMDMEDEREALVLRAEQRVDLYDRMIDARDADVDVAQARVDHASAVVQLKLAEAVGALDRANAPQIQLADYAQDVREEALNVTIAKTKFQAALKELQVAREGVTGEGELFPEMTRELDALLEMADSE